MEEILELQVQGVWSLRSVGMSPLPPHIPVLWGDGSYRGLEKALWTPSPGQGSRMTKSNHMPITARTKSKKVHTTPVFITALFTIGMTWKQPRCPSADELIKKLWYIHSMEYYSAMKKNAFESVLMRWMKLEPIIQSEISQKEKHLCSILTHIYGI